MSTDYETTSNSMNILEKFKRINEWIKGEPITIHTLQKLYNITYAESTFILNEFIIQSTSIDDYVILFQIESRDSSDNTTIYFIPNYSHKLQDIWDSPNWKSCHVFAVFQKVENFNLQNYTALTCGIETISKYDLSDVIASIKADVIKDTNKQKIEAENPEKSITRNVNNNDVTAKEETYLAGFKPNREVVPSKEKSQLPNEEKIEKKSKNNNCMVQAAFNLNEQEEDKDSVLSENEPPRRVLKKRKKKVTKTFVNDKGEMVTEDIDEEEEYWSDERQKPQKRGGGFQPSQPQKKKKVPQGQSSLFSFFNK